MAINVKQGKSGKYYIRNPFGAGAYMWAVYPSKAEYGKMLPEYISNESAEVDFDKDVYGYKFDVIQNDKTLEIYTDQMGQMVNPLQGDFKEYLETIDYTKIKHKECIITSFVA